MPCVLINSSGRVISFLGGYVEGKTINNGFRLIPTHRTSVSDEHVATIKADKIQSKIMRGYIKSGEIVDVLDVFADLPDVAAVPAPKMPEPPVARFDSTTSPAAVRAANAEPPALVESDAPLTPPPPVLAPGPVAASVEAVLNDPANVASMSTEDAIACANTQTAVAVLGTMWSAENASPNRRVEVIAAIEKRGHSLNAPK